MGEKDPRRSEADSTKRAALSRSAKVAPPRHGLLIPFALLVGFLLGTFFGRPLLLSPFAEPSASPQPTTDSAESFAPATSKSNASKIASAKKEVAEKKWDEKTIRSLPLADIRSRISQLSTWTPGPLADQVEHWLVQRWAALEPQAACQYAYTAALQGAEESLLLEALAIWATSSPAPAARWAGNLGSPSLRDSSIRTVYSTWAKIDSTAAAKSISSLRPASARGIASAATAPPHAGKNFATAMQWARALPGPIREKTLDAILGEWTRRDPAGAAGWLIGQPGDVQWALIGKLASDWVRKDPSSALSWGLGQSTEISLGSKLALGPVQRKFFEAALGAFIGTDPQGAANWLASSTGQPFFTSKIGAVAGRWTSMDPMEAASWSLSLPKESDRDAAIRAVAGTWARTDPQAAGQWARALANSTLRDTALNAYCGSLSPYDAASAAQWGTEITSPSLRKGAVESAVNRWMQYDPTAARQFILSTPALDQVTKEKLLR
ncbi:MAG: hypothetical protein NTU87_01905 [Verrucomicrobia bacterium]|nr:hypothetical protein [Verrucomicrobiota bacterium]